MGTATSAPLLAGIIGLASGCVGARGPDPALRSNAAVTQGGSELGNSGSSNDLRPGEQAPVSRPNTAPRTLSVDVMRPRGPTFQGPTESAPSRPSGAPASASTWPPSPPAGGPRAP